MVVGSNKDVSDEVRSLGQAVEEGVNTLRDESGQGGNTKAVYKRFTFDFFKA